MLVIFSATLVANLGQVLQLSFQPQYHEFQVAGVSATLANLGQLLWLNFHLQ